MKEIDYYRKCQFLKSENTKNKFLVVHHLLMVNTLHNSSDEELSLSQNRFYSNNIAIFSQGYM